MTTQEFSNTFDTLLNSYKDIKNFGNTNSPYSLELDEYEKSILLTQAQDIIVKSYFDRTLNPQGQGFDDSERRQMDFSELITINKPVISTDTTVYDDRGVLYKLPTNILFMLNEKVVSGTVTKKSFIVIPISYKEYDRLMSKPYAQPLKKQCWRLFQNVSGVDTLSELIAHVGVPITEYRIRYIRRPKPIILAPLAGGEYNDGLAIDGVSIVTECELNPIIHMDILNKAIELALIRIGAAAQPKQSNRE